MKKNKTFLIVAAVHGDEKVGVEVIKRFQGLVYQDRIRGIIANKRALRLKVRFIDQDLNRSFPGGQKGNYEEKRAYRLTKLIKKFDNVLDLHSFSCQSEPFVIVTKRTSRHLRLAEATGLERIVFMSPKLALKKALIDHCSCGISVEAGRHNQKNTYARAVGVTENILSELGFLSKKKRNLAKISCFKIVDIFLKKSKAERLEKNVKNFKLIHKGEVISKEKERDFVSKYDFYPILARERAYPKILCLAAKSVKIRKEKR